MADTTSGAAPRPTPTASQKAADAAATAAEEVKDTAQEVPGKFRTRFAAIRSDKDVRRAGLIISGVAAGAAVVAAPVTAAPIAAYAGTKAVVDTVNRRKRENQKHSH